MVLHYATKYCVHHKVCTTVLYHCTHGFLSGVNWEESLAAHGRTRHWAGAIPDKLRCVSSLVAGLIGSFIGCLLALWRDERRGVTHELRGSPASSKLHG